MKSIKATILIAAQAAIVSAVGKEVSPTAFISPSSPLATIPVHGKGFAGKQSKTTTSSSLNLSPATTASLLLRGGETPLKNFYGDALGFFGGIRIPATFLAGSSLAAIFTLKGAAMALESDKKATKLERRMIKFYHLISLLAFLLSLNTIVTATSAHTSILHGRFDHMAETAYMLMKREFDYEFVTVRWSFLTSIFCFLGMVTSRILIEYGLLKECDENRKDVAKLVMFSMGALAAHLLSYVNQNLWCWRSLVGMTIYLTKLVFERAFVDRRPLQIISVMCTLASVFYVGKLTAKDLREDDA